jgi:hypothetical protein
MLSHKAMVDKASKALSPEQALLINICAEEKASKQIEEHVKWLSRAVDEVVFKAMRENRISAVRAKRILDRAGELMKKE